MNDRTLSTTTTTTITTTTNTNTSYRSFVQYVLFRNITKGWDSVKSRGGNKQGWIYSLCKVQVLFNIKQWCKTTVRMSLPRSARALAIPSNGVYSCFCLIKWVLLTVRHSWESCENVRLEKKRKKKALDAMYCYIKSREVGTYFA